MECKQTIFIPEEPDVQCFICELRKLAMFIDSGAVSCKKSDFERISWSPEKSVERSEPTTVL